jgi:hypothetical protein
MPSERCVGERCIGEAGRDGAGGSDDASGDIDTGSSDVDGCVSRTEICNGVDDDCDTLVDEEFPNLNMPCSIGSEPCATTGTFVCATDGLRVFCQAAAPPCPVFSAPNPAQPPTTWAQSRTVTIGALVRDPDGVNASTIEYRIDANGDGDYDDAATYPAEDWTTVGLTTAQNGVEVQIAVQAGFSQDSAPDRQLSFEFRGDDVLGHGPGHSGAAGTQGIDDDWYILADGTAPQFGAALGVQRLADRWVELSWSIPADDGNFASYEIFFANTGVPNPATAELWDVNDDPRLGVVASRSTVVRNLLPSTTYWFAGRVRDLAGNVSVLSAPLSATTLDHSPLPSYSFDTCDEGWHATSLRRLGTWECGQPTSGPLADHTGGGSLWATNLDGPYTWHEDSHLESPSIDLSSATSVRVTFWHWRDFEPPFAGHSQDGGAVFGFDGTQWLQVTPQNGYDAIINAAGSSLVGKLGFTGSGPQRQWRQESIDLSTFHNQDFRLKFVFVSDIADELEGWYVDDVVFGEAG